MPSSAGVPAFLLEELEEVSGEREVWVSLLNQLPPATWPRIIRKKIDGWMV